MYDHLQGEFANITPNSLVLRAFGVGYALKISLNTYSDLKEKPSGVAWTHLAVSETSMLLYGFSTTREREVFLMLIGVTGVGCNTAITILSYMTHHEVEYAAAHENKTAFKAVKGVGEKLASQIVLDLKGKFKVEEEHLIDVLTSDVFGAKSKERDEAIMAVTSLGFNKTSAGKAVDAAISSGELALESIIKHALKNIR
jgi:Holliday junction DNA helicase RuvA